MDNNKHKNLRKRLVRNIAVNTLSIVLVLCGVGWAVLYFWRYSVYEITNNAVVDHYVTPVNIKVAGYLKEVNFTEYQKVNAGDTLIVIDEREYLLKLMDAQAALSDAIAGAAVLKSSLATAESNIRVAEATIKETGIRLWKLGEDEKRYASLLAERSVSLQQYEQIKTDYEAANAKYTLLQKQKESAILQAEELKQKQGSAEAIIERRRADVEMAKLNLTYTVVRAPYNGYVGRRSLGVGQLVQAGQVLTNIIQDTRKWVTANYKETQIKNIFIGQEVNLRIDAYGDKVFKGVVTAISDATGAKYSLIPTDNAAGNFVKVQQRIPVRIDFVEADCELLKAGMMVEVEAKIKSS